jgi:hypothetical protein
MKLLPVPGLSLAVSIGALLLLGWFFGVPFSGKDPLARRAGLAAYVGLGVGVIANVMLEELLFRRWAGQNAWPSTVIYVEHNLWPFELLMWLLGALVLMRLGASKRHASSVRTL